jgi:hypothetical protein
MKSRHRASPRARHSLLGSGKQAEGGPLLNDIVALECGAGRRLRVRGATVKQPYSPSKPSEATVVSAAATRTLTARLSSACRAVV